MGKSDKKSQAQTLEAEFKLGLISPTIHGNYPDKSINAYFDRISSQPLTMLDGTPRKVKGSTLKSWRRAYLASGFEGLLGKRRSDSGRSRSIDADLACDIQGMRLKFPKMPASTMRRKLIQDGIIEASDLSECTMQRFFKNNPIKNNESEIIKDRRAFESPYVNGIWQADTLYGPKIGPNKSKTYLQAIIDDKSRKAVSGRFYLNDNAVNFQSTLKNGISSHGLPQKLYVDNGSSYKNEQLSLICGSLGIVLSHAPVRDGAAKGKIERFNRTVRMKFLCQLESVESITIDELNNAFSKWVAEYNNTIHSSTKTTPNEAFNLGCKDIKWFDGDNDDLERAFMNRTIRKVANDSTIRIEKILYDVPMFYIGQRVEIRWFPGYYNNVWLVTKDNRLLELVPTNKEENSKVSRINSGYKVNYLNEEE